MLNEFIKKLATLLNDCEVPQSEKNEILDDYRQIIEDGKEKNLKEETIIKMMGSPEAVIKELGFRKKSQHKNQIRDGEKFIALSPFISFIIFIVLGLTKNLWHPGWLVFLLIPVSAIIIELANKKDSYILTALSPFIASLFFLLMGFIYNIWHPTWLIFVIIPFLAIVESKKEMENVTFLTALSPFISIMAFTLISYYTGDFKYSWLVFLLVVLFGSLHEPDKKNKFILLSSLILSVALYVGIMLMYDNWVWAAFSFIFLILAGIYTDNITFSVSKPRSKFDLMIVFLSFLLFIGIGYFLDLWAISWLLLFIIPITMIIKYNKKPPIFTPLSPFISIALFILLGYFFGLWHISWIVLLLIPITAIIENA